MLSKSMTELAPALILSVALLMSGCASGPADSPADSGPRAVTAAGTVKPAGITSFMYGSHLLYDASGQLTYALTSQEVQLEEWEGERVQLSGSLKEGYPVDNGPPYVAVQAIQSAEGRGRGE